jgi:hypothetical protein
MKLPTERATWREPMLWLVWGGPALVVAASLATAVIAWRGADIVLTEASVPASASQQPALKARNHAAAPREPAAARP